MAQFDSLLRQLKLKLKRQEETVRETKGQIVDLEVLITAGSKK